MAKKPMSRAGRLSWSLIRWAALMAVIGAALCAIGVVRVDWDQRWAAALVALGGGIALTSCIFLALGLFAVRVGPRGVPIGGEQQLIVRAAAAVVLTDSDAAHVEIEALRVWMQRRYGLELTFDQLLETAHESAGRHDAIIAEVAEAHRAGGGWGRSEDEALIGATGAVIVADLRCSDHEMAYLRRLAAAVQLEPASIEALVAKLKALERELESIIVEALAARTTLDFGAA
jgi:uncharacterized tellurite resistance protein B-like protein